MNDERFDRIFAIANMLRLDVLDMMGIGKAGHLGGSISLAEIVAALYFDIMKYGQNIIDDPNRDRFILSKGHAVLIQYAALVELGIISRGELIKAKSLEGILQGHPDMESTPGMEAVTGSLGQGLSIGIGMALAARLDGRKSRIFVILGDGEIAEGQIWEAAMFASTYKLSNIVAIVDRNGIQSTGKTIDVFDIPRIAEKWRSFGWHVRTIDGHDVREIISAFKEAETIKEIPTVIIANTIKGKGISYAENSAAFHNASLTKEQMKIAVQEIMDAQKTHEEK